MSAERLREAAGVLRQRAEAATPGPWCVSKTGHIDAGEYDTVIGRGPVECMAYCYGGSSTIEGDRLDEDRAYIATMSPPVALALADWLDHAAGISEEPDEADELAEQMACDCPYCKGIPLAVAVADAILGAT